MSNTFDRIFLTMGKIIGGINIPGIASAVMGHLFDSVHHRIAHIDIWRGHIDLGAQCHGALINRTLLHLLEKREALFRRSLAVGAVFTRFGQCAPILAHIFGI